MNEFEILNYFERVKNGGLTEEQAWENSYTLLDRSCMLFATKKRKEERQAELKVKIDEIRNNGWKHYVEMYLTNLHNDVSSLQYDMKGKMDDPNYYD